MEYIESTSPPTLPTSLAVRSSRASWVSRVLKQARTLRGKWCSGRREPNLLFLVEEAQAST